MSTAEQITATATGAGEQAKRSRECSGRSSGLGLGTDSTQLVDGTPEALTLSLVQRPASADAPGTMGFTPRPGDELGPYRIREQLGQGGMGAVYLATDTRLEREVALKLLHPQAGFDQDAVLRLRREAKALALLNHPNVVQVFGVEETSSSVCVAMEYVPGEDLAKWLEAGARPAAAVLELFLQAGRGLAAAHENGLVHRDFKPANVLVGSDGRVRVVDFGIARLVSAPVARPTAVRNRDFPAAANVADDSLTAGLTVIGTLRYMAPEQHAGEGTDARADQYAFCLALAESLLGERLFARPDLEAEKRRGPPVQRLRKLPKPLRLPLARGLSAQPRDRFDSMVELLRALEYKPRSRFPVLAVFATTPGVLWAALPDEQSCAHGGTSIGIAWSHQHVQQIGSVLRRSGEDDKRLDRIAAALGGYAERWTRTHIAACEARETTDPAIYDRKMSCLRDRKAAFAAQVAALTATSEVTAAKALEAALTLPEVEACGDEQRARDAAEPEPPEHLQAAVDELNRRLEEVRAQTRLGAYASALAQSQALLIDAEATRFAPLINRVRHEVATALADLGHYDDAFALGERVYHDAKAQSQIDLAVTAAARMAGDMAGLQEFADTAERWARHIRADLSSRPHHDDGWVKLLLLEGAMFFQRGGYEASASRYEQALERLQATLPDDSLPVLRARSGLAHAWIGLGRVKDAIALGEEVLDKMTSIVGPEHPALLGILDLLAWAYERRDDSERAYTLARRMVAVRTELLGTTHWRLLQDWTNLGALAQSAGRLQEAEQAYEKAATFVEDALRHGQFAPVVSLHYNFGTFLLHKGERGQTAQMYYRALEATPPEMARVRVTIMHALAQFETDDDNFAAAHRWFEQAWRILEDHDYEHTTEAGELLLSWARAFGNEGHSAQALHSVERALAILVPVAGPRSSYVLRGSWIRADALRATDPAAATEAYATALEIAEELRDPRAPALALRLATLVEKRDPARARALVQRGLQYARSMPAAASDGAPLEAWLRSHAAGAASEPPRGTVRK